MGHHGDRASSWAPACGRGDAGRAARARGRDRPRARRAAVRAAWRAVIGAVALIGVALDLGWAGLRLPTVRRQVNEDWLHRYRGGVYGFGFGFQLGLGVATIVTTAAVYLTFVFALSRRIRASAASSSVPRSGSCAVRAILGASPVSRPRRSCRTLHRRLPAVGAVLAPDRRCHPARRRDRVAGRGGGDRRGESWRSFDSAGMKVDLPSGWDARIYRRQEMACRGPTQAQGEPTTHADPPRRQLCAAGRAGRLREWRGRADATRQRAHHPRRVPPRQHGLADVRRRGPPASAAPRRLRPDDAAAPDARPGGCAALLLLRRTRVSRSMSCWAATPTGAGWCGLVNAVLATIDLEPR